MRTIIEHYTFAAGENLIASINNSAVGNYSYAYDAGDNKTAETITGVMSGFGFDTGTAGYDDEDRLTNWERDDTNLDQSWNLSAVGDWTSFTENTVAVSRTHNAVHELTAIATTPLTYDAKGNLTTDAAALTYAWDADNMLSSATVPTAPSRGLEGTHTYTYDALGRRTSKTVNDTQQSTTETTVFVSLTQPIPYSPHAGQVQAEYTSGTPASSPLRKYTYGSYIDDPLTLIDRTAAGTLAAGTDEPFTYHRNQQYSIAALSDATGTLSERYYYTPYGKTTITAPNGTTVRTTSDLGNNYTYTGRQLDGESELHYFRARYVNPVMGRFVSRDPLEYIDGWILYTGDFLPSDIDPSGFRPPSKGGGNCPSYFLLWGKILALMSQFTRTGMNHATPSYPSMPFQHCVWNCRMANSDGVEYAEELSFQKEAMDVAICEIGESIPDRCLKHTDRPLLEMIAGHCCSAEQPADYKDNATGRACVCSRSGCEDCCLNSDPTLGPNNPDGPGTDRPCGPNMPDRLLDYLPENGLYGDPYIEPPEYEDPYERLWPGMQMQ